MHPGVHSEAEGSKIAYFMAESGESFTYKQLDDSSNQAAHLFRSRGLRSGDGIALLLENHPLYLQICWGAQRSGLYFTPISILFQSSEIEYIIDNSDSRLLITSEQHLKKLNSSRLDKLETIFVVDTAGSTGASGSIQDCVSWQTEAAQQPSTPILDECEGAEMIYSSGTTGLPKGVRFPLKKDPLGTVSTLFKSRVDLHQVNQDSIYLSTAPLYHSAPLRYNLMVTRLGGTCVIMKKFDAKTALELIQIHQITHSQWVPTMFNRLLKLPKQVRESHNVSSLRFAIHAAAPCPIEIKERMIKWWGPVLYEYYSGTEANGSTAISPQEWLLHKGSVGKAIHGEVHILDDEGRELPVGEPGIVYFANGSDFHYYKDPEKTAKAKNESGWSTLGDMGYLDQEGYLYLTDRQSFMIISGGVNIYPQEVENLLTTHPLVADVAVFGIPNEEFGEEVKAVIELADPELAAEELAAELIDWCRTRISHVKCPSSVDFSRQLPRHPTGKLYKQKLKDQYWSSHSSKII